MNKSKNDVERKVCASGRSIKIFIWIFYFWKGILVHSLKMTYFHWFAPKLSPTNIHIKENGTVLKFCANLTVQKNVLGQHNTVTFLEEIQVY